MATDVRVHWAQLDTQAPALDARVYWAQLDTQAQTLDVRVSWVQLDTQVQADEPVIREVSWPSAYRPRQRPELFYEERIAYQNDAILAVIMAAVTSGALDG